MKTISDIFNRINGTTPQPVVPVVDLNKPAVVDPSKPAASAGPDGSGPAAFPAVKKDDTSPLAGFDALWQTTDKDGKPPELATNITADPQKLMDAAKSIDFVKGIDPQLLADAAKGGNSEALGKLINTAAQLGYAQSAGATARIVNAALAEQGKKFTQEYFPELMRRMEANRLLAGDNAIFQNPAIKPVLDMIETQLANKYPTASSADISAKAKEFVLGMSTEVLKSSGLVVSEKPKIDPAKSGGNKDIDWASLFGIPEGASF